MKRIQALGSAFFAFIAGGTLATAAAIYTALFLLDVLPQGWVLLLLSSIALTIAAMLWAYLAMLLQDLEGAVQSIPSGLAAAERHAAAKNLAGKAATRSAVFLALALLMTLAGLALLPIRLVVRDSNGPRKPAPAHAPSTGASLRLGHELSKPIGMEG